MTYPADIDSFRTVENLPGITLNVDDKKTIFAEDLTARSTAIVAIETELGLLPKGSKASVKARLDDVDTALSGKQATIGFTPENVANKKTTTTLGTSNTYYPTQGAVKTYVDNAISAVLLAAHPVNSIYISISNTNPGTIFGGTWTAWGSGRVPVGVDTAQTEFNTVEKTGGHKLLQSHSHNGYIGCTSAEPSDWPQRIRMGNSAGAQISGTALPNTGGGDSQNLQPYITCYMWKRTA